MSHDTDLIIRQDEKSKEDKRQKRKRRKKKKAATEEEEDGTPQDKKAHVEDMDEAGEEREEQKEEKKVHGKVTAQDEEMPSGETLAVESQSDPGKKERSDAPQTHDPKPDARNERPKASERKVEGGTHRAGFDAFMTGYIFAFACIRNTEGSDSWIPACANKLYLSGKSVPLHIVKSTFSKSSRAHVTKMEHVWRTRFPKADGNA